MLISAIVLITLTASGSQQSQQQEHPWSPDLLLFGNGDEWTWETESVAPQPTNWPTKTRTSIKLKLTEKKDGWNHFRATWTAQNMDRFEVEWPTDRAQRAYAEGKDVPPPVVEPILEIAFKQNVQSRDVILEWKKPLNSPKGFAIDQSGAGALILPGTWSKSTSYTGGDQNFVPSPKLMSSIRWRYVRDDVVKSNLGLIHVKVFRGLGTSADTWTESYINPRFGLALGAVSQRDGKIIRITRITAITVPSRDGG